MKNFWREFINENQGIEEAIEEELTAAATARGVEAVSIGYLMAGKVYTFYRDCDGELVFSVCNPKEICAPDPDVADAYSIGRGVYLVTLQDTACTVLDRVSTPVGFQLAELPISHAPVFHALGVAAAQHAVMQVEKNLFQ